MNARTARPAGISPADTDYIQLLFTDVAGRLKSLEVPSSRWGATRDRGWSVDGSVVLGDGDRGHRNLRLVPDPDSFVVRPWHTPSGRSVGLVFCHVLDADGEPFAADARTRLRQAVVRSEARGQLPVFGAEADFYLLRDTQPAMAPADDGGCWDLVGQEQADEVCRDTSDALELMGCAVSGHRHEAGPGQRVIVFRHGGALATADRLLLLKHTARTMARRRGMRAVFMPKPLAHRHGNALRVHVSLRGTDTGARPLFHDPDAPWNMSTLFRQSLAGVLEHADALTALGNPTVNSYKRLAPVPGAPVYRAWGRDNGPIAFKVAGDGAVPESMRLELRSPDSATHPHLLFTAVLAAFRDGQDRGLKLPEAYEELDASPNAPGGTTCPVGLLPTDLPAALRALEEDATVLAAVGEPAVRSWTARARADWHAWHQLVTSWEVDRYLESV